jgi:hypothetical protein
MDYNMKKYILGCMIVFNALAANSFAQFLDNYADLEDFYPRPQVCTEPAPDNAPDQNFCGCFIEQAIAGCNYATDGAFYCKEFFIKGQIKSIPNNDDAILQFCIKYRVLFPQDDGYDEYRCRDHVKYYKNSCN